MLDYGTWLERILSVAKDLSDERYQERAWIRGSGAEVDSLSEAINRLFDDYDFDGFVRECSHTGVVPVDKLRALEALRQSLDQYLSNASDDDQIAVRDPRWQEIRRRARGVVEAFSQEAPAR